MTKQDENNLRRKEIKHRDIIERIREIRIENDLTQQEFSEMTGESLSVIKAIETGRITPSIQLIKKLHKRFKKSYNWIIEGKE